MIKHTIAPIYDKNSRILILGSFPSVKSREQQFFYGHVPIFFAIFLSSKKFPVRFTRAIPHYAFR